MKLFPIPPCVKNLLEFIFSLVCSQDRSTVVFKPIYNYYNKGMIPQRGGILCYAKELIRHENLRLQELWGPTSALALQGMC